MASGQDPKKVFCNVRGGLGSCFCWNDEECECSCTLGECDHVIPSRIRSLTMTSLEARTRTSETQTTTGSLVSPGERDRHMSGSSSAPCAPDAQDVQDVASMSTLHSESDAWSQL